MRDFKSVYNLGLFSIAWHLKYSTYRKSLRAAISGRDKTAQHKSKKSGCKLDMIHASAVNGSFKLW